MWTVTLDDAQYAKWVKTLYRRMMVLGETIAQRGARHFQRDVLRRIPNGFRTYRKSWRVGRYVQDEDVSGYAVYASARATRVRTLDTKRTLLIVRPVQRFLITHPELRVLSSFSPWTTDTLPFYPPRKMAQVISRKVSTEEAKKVRTLRQEEQKTWQPLLTEAGYRSARKTMTALDESSAKAVPDVAFEGMRLEWGLGGGHRKAHVRPALRALVTRGFSGILRSRRVQDLVNPSSIAWRRGPPVERRIGGSLLRSLVFFQRRLGRVT